MQQLYSIIKHVETGEKYIVYQGEPLPSNAYIFIRKDITLSEANKYITPRANKKQRC